MELKSIKLGGFVSENIQAINDNFADLDLGKADVADLPGKVSQLQNDSNFQTLTQVQALIAALVDSAPETLDTLRELAEALGNDPDFAATMAAQIGQKVDKAEGKGLSSNDFSDGEKEKLAGLSNYTLPAGGANLGGVKNGGNVTISADGTMTAAQGANVTKVEFSASDSRWGTLANGKYTLTLPGGGKSFMGAVWRENAGKFAVVMADVTADGENLLIESFDKFAGYVNLI